MKSLEYEDLVRVRKCVLRADKLINKLINSKLADASGSNFEKYTLWLACGLCDDWISSQMASKILMMIC